MTYQGLCHGRQGGGTLWVAEIHEKERPHAAGVEWGEDYRIATRAALKQVLQARMDDPIASHLDAMARCGSTAWC